MVIIYTKKRISYLYLELAAKMTQTILVHSFFGTWHILPIKSQNKIPSISSVLVGAWKKASKKPEPKEF